MAPLVGGWLLVLNTAFPVYAAVVILLFSSLAVLCLKEPPQDAGGEPQQVSH